MAEANHSAQPGTTPAFGLPNFDRVARIYRLAEYLCLGPLLKRTREHFLSKVRCARNVLALGDGDGRFVARLLQVAPQSKVVAVDTSAVMLGLLRKRCRFASDRLQTVQADFVRPCSQEELCAFDLIVSHFSLDCLSSDQLRDLVDFVATSAAPGTFWLVSDFATPTLEPWRSIGNIYVRCLYEVFGLLTGLRVRQLPRIYQTLAQAGMRRVAEHKHLRGLLFSGLWQVQLSDSDDDEDNRATRGSSLSSTNCEH